MRLSHGIRNALIGAGVVILAGVGSLLIPPAESYKNVPSDRPWAQEFRANLFKTNSNDVDATALLSAKLCKGLTSELKQGVDQKAGMAEIDNAMTQIGAHIGKMPAYINKGYITYYFRPIDPTMTIDQTYEKTLSSFAAQSIGPKYAWLNPKWYNAHNDQVLDSVGKKFIKIDGPYISIAFETPFPLLDEYTQHGLMQTPPPYVESAAEYAGLAYAGTQRRDTFEYTYSIDMRHWYEKFGGDRYYNINFQVSARKVRGAGLTEWRITPTCTFPSKGVLYTNLGTPPADDPNATILPPVYIPSCPAYQKWFRCQNDKVHETCDAVDEADVAPACPPDAPDFPRSDYPAHP